MRSPSGPVRTPSMAVASSSRVGGSAPQVNPIPRNTASAIKLDAAYRMGVHSRPEVKQAPSRREADREEALMAVVNGLPKEKAADEVTGPPARRAEEPRAPVRAIMNEGTVEAKLKEFAYLKTS